MKKEEYFVKINKNRLNVLNVVSANSPKGINQSKIVMSLTLSTSTIDRIVKDLYLMGLVESKFKDNRTKLYSITNEGKKIWKLMIDLRQNTHKGRK